MKINRNNYEAFFLLYTDNELNAEERTMVEGFIALHPDLAEELSVLSQTRLHADDQLVYADKTGLLRQTTTGLINENNYKEYFLLYTDEELNAEEKRAVEEFAAASKEKQAELLLLQKVKIQPDENIVFNNKEVLYRTERKPARVVPVWWIRVAAAAAVLLTGIAVWTNINDNETGTGNSPAQTVIADKSNSVKYNSSRHGQNNQEGTASSVKEDILAQDVATNEPGNSAASTTPEKAIVKKEVRTIEAKSTDSQKKPDVENINIANTAIASVKDHVTEDINNSPQTTVPLIAANNEAKPNRDVKPLILDAAAFDGQDKTLNETPADKNNNKTAFLEPGNDKKPKGKLRELFRKASRIIDHATNAGEANDQSVVRIASFEIAKK